MFIRLMRRKRKDCHIKWDKQTRCFKAGLVAFLLCAWKCTLKMEQQSPKETVGVCMCEGKIWVCFLSWYKLIGKQPALPLLPIYPLPSLVPTAMESPSFLSFFKCPLTVISMHVLPSLYVWDSKCRSCVPYSKWEELCFLFLNNPGLWQSWLLWRTPNKIF